MDKHKRENEDKVRSLRFNKEEIQLTVKLAEKLKPTLDIIYYLLDHNYIDAFVLILMQTNHNDIQSFMDKEKRDTDILFTIDEEEFIYLILCEDTQIYGGYHFADRIISSLKEVVDKDKIYCTELEVRTTHYEYREIILRLAETFIKSRQEKKSGEIIFNTVK